ncbi:MAG: hypothetical protein HQK50_19225 [Oligoflexia bacterium]|nr:hypothetical protein [Oligoflexia bacterium]MBF0367710.1 hypothetical protein [Oligoflexia bacterium]
MIGQFRRIFEFIRYSLLLLLILLIAKAHAVPFTEQELSLLEKYIVDQEVVQNLRIQWGDTLTIEVVKKLLKANEDLSDISLMKKIWGDKISLEDVDQLISKKIGIYSVVLLREIWGEKLSFEDVKKLLKANVNLNDVSVLRNTWGDKITLEDVEKLIGENIDLYSAALFRKSWGNELTLENIIELKKHGIALNLLAEFDWRGKYFLGKKRTIENVIDLYKKDPSKFTLENSKHNQAKLIEQQDRIARWKVIKVNQDFLCIIIRGVGHDPHNAFQPIREKLLWKDSMGSAYSIKSNGKECMVFPDYWKMMDFINQLEREKLLLGHHQQKILILQEAHGNASEVACDSKFIEISTMINAFALMLKKYKVSFIEDSCYSGTHLRNFLRALSKTNKDNFCMIASGLVEESSYRAKDFRDEPIFRFFELANGESILKLAKFGHMSSNLPFSTLAHKTSNLSSSSFELGIDALKWHVLTAEQVEKIKILKKHVEREFPENCHLTGECSTCNMTSKFNIPFNALFRSLYQVMFQDPKLYMASIRSEDRDAHQACKDFVLHFGKEYRKVAPGALMRRGLHAPQKQSTEP